MLWGIRQYHTLMMKEKINHDAKAGTLELPVKKSKSSFMIHGSWAIAVLLAFSFGLRRGDSLAGKKEGEGNGSNATSSMTSMGESASETRNNRSVDREKNGMADSKLEGLFGKVVSSSASLEMLAAQAVKDSNPITRRLAFSRLLEALTPENAEAIRAQLLSLGADGEQWQEFHYSWGAISGKVAFEHAMNSKEPDLAATMTGWAAANPSEALAMLNNLPEGVTGQRDELTASIVSGLSHRDPAMATDLVLKLGIEGNGNAGKLMEIVAKETIRSLGAEQASVWAEALPDGPLKGTAMSRIADSYARANLASAAQWAARFADKDYAANSIAQIGGRWAEKDPAAAADWLGNLPDGRGQKDGLNRVFSDWEDTDPAAAGKYLLAMPYSAKRDSAISGFAMGYAWQNPQLSLGWAQDIQDPALRQSSVNRAAQIYFQRDPQAARAWMDSNGMSAEAQQKIISGGR